MKISNLKYQTFFQKKFKANCQIRKNGRPHQCAIYEITPEKDSDYFEKLKNEKPWHRSKFCSQMAEKFKYKSSYDENTFVMEDENEHCLGFIDIQKDSSINIYTIEAKPKEFFKDKYKYIGETLIAFIANLAKKENKTFISIPQWTKSSKNFYKKIGFKQSKFYSQYLLLNSSNFDKLIQKNKRHTQ